MFEDPRVGNKTKLQEGLDSLLAVGVKNEPSKLCNIANYSPTRFR